MATRERLWQGLVEEVRKEVTDDPRTLSAFIKVDRWLFAPRLVKQIAVGLKKT